MSNSTSGPRHKLLTGDGPTQDQAPLAEGEGVNAASAEQTDEADEAAGQGGPDGTLGGGHPEDAPDQKQALTGYGAAAEGAEQLGAPGADPREPSQTGGSSGQDAGSMD